MAWVSAEGKRQRELVPDPDIPTLHRHRGHGGGGVGGVGQTPPHRQTLKGNRVGLGGPTATGCMWELLRNSQNEVSPQEGKAAFYTGKTSSPPRLEGRADTALSCGVEPTHLAHFGVTKPGDKTGKA